MNLAEETKQWREGPSLNDKREFHAAVVCRGGVHVIGGNNGSSRLEKLNGLMLQSCVQNQWKALPATNGLP